MNSYSQNGEDRVFIPLLPPRGRLLDIGAFDAVELSNSRALIEQGWEAVLVEANPLCVYKLTEFYKNAEANENVQIVNALVVGLPTPTPDVRLSPFNVCWDAVSTTDESHYALWKDTVCYLPLHMASTSVAALLRTFPGPYDFVSIDVEGNNGVIFENVLDLLTLTKFPSVICVEYSKHDEARILELARWFEYRTVSRNSENIIFQRTVGRAAEAPAFQAG